MLILVHPNPPTQPPRPPKGRRSVSLHLTPDEERHARGALRNIKNAFGSWEALAKAVGVAESTLHHALKRGRGSAILFLRVAQAGKMSFDDMLTGRLSAVDRCPACGASRGR